MEFDNSFWATVGLVIFFGIIVYLGVPRQIGKMLDARIARIREEIDEARRLRDEAKALLAEYEEKRQAAEGEAEGIVTAAREEAARLAEEASASLDDLIARRTRAVEEKIAQAESQALAEVRARSADVAIEAARVILREQMGDKGDELIEQSIKDVAARLN